MKKILRDTCILSALMILAVFAVSVIWSGVTDEIKLVFRLFGLGFLIAVLNRVIDEFCPFSILLSYVVKYFAVTCLVMLYGFIAGWFYRSNFWMAFIYVGAVLVMAYFLDILKTRKDIAFINEKIKERTLIQQ